ncbi:helix-turn-helix domain-containing protein [Clavibacter michiganensis]|uniref:helix-turn-helix domain-containing protein n=1 Tax=Clavibacter michiganensis TaxID=28447 RepID=UPI0026DCA350|nr:helix-turn-helix transcriptional regulator [Clavibacter michiganensis]MDO4039341.1 helix-turn-helix transcriptional regulator [Clavibacter michiganensis]MDO4063978.1 helix-turn-helix transcriptional regulator [Clavibacter michiganensis]MDO4110163.1 helix-turn-helix transcriptional regulator [Clavibacter michiganensis]MDO4113341.1 helix-turn-helix transcriptional regulator [Clavibacter michiganensis]MDO4116677.1 helix-turn-helix transcriptional regulator [Clavibacter michiganensis]
MPLAPQALPGALTRSLGRVLRARMVDRAVSLAEAARAVDVSEGQLSRMLHGKRRMDVEQLDLLCRFLEVDAVETLRAAKTGTLTAAETAPAAGIEAHDDLGELARRMRTIARLRDGGGYRAVATAAARAGVELSQNDWHDLLDGAVGALPSHELLGAISSALGVPRDYLTSGDREFADRVEAEEELAHAMRTSGTLRIAARNLSSLSPDEILAIAKLVRDSNPGGNHE